MPDEVLHENLVNTEATLVDREYQSVNDIDKAKPTSDET